MNNPSLTEFTGHRTRDVCEPELGHRVSPDKPFPRVHDYYGQSGSREMSIMVILCDLR